MLVIPSIKQRLQDTVRLFNLGPQRIVAQPVPPDLKELEYERRQEEYEWERSEEYRNMQLGR